MPFMGKIAVPKGKGFPPSIQDCGAGEIYAYLVAALILRQHFIDSNGDKLPFLSRNRNRMGVIFPFVSVQEIICTGIFTHSMLSIGCTPFLAVLFVDRSIQNVCL